MASVFEELKEFFPLKVRTSPEWAAAAVKDMNTFMVDHAFCERKASAAALSLVINYPEKHDFCEAMIQLAMEELEHFHQVFRILKSRGISLSGDAKDPYVNGLLKHSKNDPEGHFLDRLLCFGIVEARGCERFDLVGDVVDDPALKDFYHTLARAEARHFGIFIRYGKQYCGEAATLKRLDELLVHEAELIKSLPWRASLH